MQIPKTIKLVVIATVVALLVAAGAWFTFWRTKGVNTSSLPATRASSTGHVTNNQTASAPPFFLQSRTASNATALSSLVTDLYASTDWVDYIAKAKRDPNGGYFMAATVSSICSKVTFGALKQFVAEPDPKIDARDLAQRKEVFASLEQRCKGYERVQQGSADLEKEGRRSGDPIMRLMDDARNARLSEDPTVNGVNPEFVKRAMDMNNPYALDVVVGALLVTDQSRIRFEGKPISEEEYPYFSAGMSLTSCAFGMDCGVSSTWAMESCIISGRCGLDRFQQFNFTPEEMEKVRAYYDRIASAYSSGNYSIVSSTPRK